MPCKRALRLTAWAFAMELSREGAHVAIAARTEAELQATAEEIRRVAGNRVLALPADVSVAAEIEALGRAVEAEYGRHDLLFGQATRV